MSVIIGISHSHNGSVALISDGEVKSAIQGERISRQKRKSLRFYSEMGVNSKVLKNDTKLTQDCINYCLDASGFKHSDIEVIAISTPWKCHKVTNSELFKYIGGTPKKYTKTFYVPHHYAHMEYIAHYGDLKPGIILVIDGSGSLESDRSIFNIKEKYDSKITNYTHFAGKEVVSAYWFDGFKSTLIYRFSPSISPAEDYNKDANRLNQSIGHYWRWGSSYCYGSPNEAGKVMGLAAFGKKDEIIKEKILSISDKGWIKVDYQKIREKFDKPNIFNLDLSKSKHHQNIALKIQSETEEVILKLLLMLKEKYPTDTLYFSGGVALNVVANERIKNSNLFKNVILNGSVEDNGTAIGAALAASVEQGFERKSSVIKDYYGRKYSNKEILKAVSEYSFSYKILDSKEINKIAAELIGKEKVLGWFQDGSEFGPRALGNRSILANPISPSTKHILDHYMKSRERYRPYAPVVIEELADQYFDMVGASPVMMRNVKVLDKKLKAITHFDGTARVQTVNKKENKNLYSLLFEVKKNIGYPILLNTSFNLPGEPIIESPHDALFSFSRGSLDYLFLENVLISRKKQ
tara:strand:- start:687 stop:2423 length:1737 start_codon:yes stop_codon:yes gene_type:complete